MLLRSRSWTNPQKLPALLEPARQNRERPQFWGGYHAPIGDGLRGYLIDDRGVDHLRITMFSQPEGSKIMDPLCTFRINRTAEGGLDYDDIKIDWSLPMINFRIRVGDKEEKVEALGGLHKMDTGYDLFIPHALFAMLASPDLGGIIPHEGEVFSAKDMKTARKFGKSWVMGAQKSHLTIRIGPHAIAHMRERQARREFGGLGCQSFESFLRVGFFHKRQSTNEIVAL